MRNERKDFLKFLITEVKTSFILSAKLEGSVCHKWMLVFDGQKNES